MHLFLKHAKLFYLYYKVFTFWIYAKYFRSGSELCYNFYLDRLLCRISYTCDSIILDMDLEVEIKEIFENAFVCINLVYLLTFHLYL